jgi:hypothetical protein
MVLCLPITRASFKSFAPSIPDKYRDNISQMFDLTRLKSILEFDPARGYQFSTKHNSDLQGTQGAAIQWIRRQRRQTGSELSPGYDEAEGGTFADRVAQGATQLRHHVTGQSGYDDPTNIVDDIPDSESHRAGDILRRAIERTRKTLSSAKATDANRARLLVLEKRVLAVTRDDEPVSLQQLGEVIGVSKERIRQYEGNLRTGIVNNVADICLAEQHQLEAADLQLIAAFARTTLNEVPPSQRAALTYKEAERKTTKLIVLAEGKRQR